MPASKKTSAFVRVIAGADTRKSRLHDEAGNMVSGSRLVRNGPLALWTGLCRLTLGARPLRPWISYDAQRELDQFLSRDCSVLEFGSGMSTIWYSQRAGSVVSVEDNEGWYHTVAATLQKQSNIEYRLAKSLAEYVTVPRRSYDLIMVDGSHRAESMEIATELVAPGGIIYLDNSDKGRGGLPGDVPRAVDMLLQFATGRQGIVKYFTDFAPTQLFVQQGLMVTLP